MTINNNEIEIVRNKANISQIIQKYVPLVKKGRNYWCVCPFHDDKNPSCSISEDKQIWKCFVCLEGGNVFQFVQKIENISFPLAFKKVAEWVNYDISKYEIKQQKEENPEKLKIYEINNDANLFFKYFLKNNDNKESYNYLLKRGISEEDMNSFDIGLSPENEDLISFLIKKGHEMKDIYKAGLVVEKNGNFYSFFKKRIMFAIKNKFNNIVGFSGRSLEDSAAKYVNSPETLVFKKNELIYNIQNVANNSYNEIYLLEGFMDVIACLKVGIKNCVAVMGTALTKENINNLRKVSNNIVLSFDSDMAGQKATIKSISEMLKLNMSPKCTVPSDQSKDADEILKESGKEGLKNYFLNQISWLEYKINFYIKNFNIKKNDDFQKVIKLLRDDFKYLNNDLDVEFYINHLSNLMSISTQIIRKELISNERPSIRINDSIPEKLDSYLKIEAEIIYQITESRKALEWYRANLSYLNNEVYRTLISYLIFYYEQNTNQNNVSISSFMDLLEGEEERKEFNKIMIEAEMLNWAKDETFEWLEERKIKVLRRQIEIRITNLNKIRSNLTDEKEIKKIESEINTWIEKRKYLNNRK